MWKMIQASVVIALVFSNALWPWTPNPYVPVAFGVFAAGVLTWGVTRIWEICRHSRPRRPEGRSLAAP
jgi:hypothetical protein